MNSIKFIFSILLVPIVLSSCSKQPSEMQKATIEGKILGCLTLVNEDPNDDSAGGGMLSLFGQLGSLPGKVGSISSKSWEVNTEQGQEVINLEFETEDTLYSCDFITALDEGYQVSEVRRNDEVVFNRVVNKQIKEAARIAKTQIWEELGYSNASYKYYQKHHSESKFGFIEPTFKVDCKPEGAEASYDDGKFGMRDRQAVSFSFVTPTGAEEGKFDLDSSGEVGKWSDSRFGGDVYADVGETQRFMDMMKKAVWVDIDGFRFGMDDLGQIPCI